MKNIEGIMVYEILPDGNLNGIGADTYKNHLAKTCVHEDFLYNECARKIDGKPKEIEGDYTTCYMDLKANYIIAELKITKGTQAEHGQYFFEWKENKRNKYKGLGWQTRENQLVVRYENAQYD